MKQRNDHRVWEIVTRAGIRRWQVRLGGEGGDIISTCSTQSDAQGLADRLNKDPWALNRTISQRSKNY